MKNTVNYRLRMPEPEDYFDVANDNYNAEIVDGQLKTVENAINSAQSNFSTHKNSTILDHPDGSVTDTKIGDRTISDSVAPTSDTGKLNGILGGLANVLKSVMGTSSWRALPTMTISGIISALGLKASIDSPTLTGTPKVPTASTGTSTTQAASTEFVGAAINAHNSDLTRHIPYVAATGTTNAYVAVLSPAPTTLTAGLALAVLINVGNTGASTINVNGLGAKSILSSKGVALTSGKLVTNGVYTLRYNGTAFILQGEGGEGNAVGADVLSSKTFTNDSGLQTGTMPNRSGQKFQICGYEEITEVIPHPTDSLGQGLITGKNVYNNYGYIDSASQIQMSVANLVPKNIRKGVPIGRTGGLGTQVMTGTWDGNFSTKSMLPSPGLHDVATYNNNMTAKSLAAIGNYVFCVSSTGSGATANYNTSSGALTIQPYAGINAAVATNAIPHASANKVYYAHISQAGNPYNVSWRAYDLINNTVSFVHTGLVGAPDANINTGFNPGCGWIDESTQEMFLAVSSINSYGNNSYTYYPYIIKISVAGGTFASNWSTVANIGNLNTYAKYFLSGDSTYLYFMTNDGSNLQTYRVTRSNGALTLLRTFTGAVAGSPFDGVNSYLNYLSHIHIGNGDYIVRRTPLGGGAGTHDFSLTLFSATTGAVTKLTYPFQGLGFSGGICRNVTTGENLSYEHNMLLPGNSNAYAYVGRLSNIYDLF